MDIKTFSILILIMLTGCAVTPSPNECKQIECLDFNNAKTEKERQFAASIYGDGYQNAMARNGVLQLPALEAYLQQIVNRLLIPVGKIKFTPKVIVTPDGYQSTSALPDGTILVPLDLVHQAQSEDEIAWVLGHELSHLLLGHFTQESSKQYMGGMMSKAANTRNIMENLSYISRGKNLLGDSTKKVDKIAKYSKKFYMISNDYLLSAWSREQESEADLFAIDLLQKAGYDLQVNTVLERLLKTTKEEDQKFDQFSKELETAFKEQLVPEIIESELVKPEAEYYDTGESKFEQMFNNFDTATITTQLQSMSETTKNLITGNGVELGENLEGIAIDVALQATLKLLEQYKTVHPNINKRMEVANEYIETHYDEYEPDETVEPLEQIKQHSKLKRIFEGYTIFKKMKTKMVNNQHKGAEKIC